MTKRKKRMGRPTKNEGKLNYNLLDRILVHGEIVEGDDGKGTKVVYPSHRELGRRWSVDHSLISRYSRQHKCPRRRKEAQLRMRLKADEKVIEERAENIADSKIDALAIIDDYTARFQRAVAEDRVRCDNPADFNTLMRLKEFLQGGADSRAEVHAISLVQLQARHGAAVRAGKGGREIDGVTPKPVHAAVDDVATESGSAATASAIAAGQSTEGRVTSIAAQDAQGSH